MKQSQCTALHSSISHKSLDVALNDVVETYQQGINNVEAERTDQCAKCWREGVAVILIVLQYQSDRSMQKNQLLS